MATDPNQFRVAPATGRLGTMQVPAVQNQAGRQLQQFGQAVQGASQQVQEIHLKTLRDANAAAVNDAAIRAKELELDLTHGAKGYTTLKGRNAIDRPDGVDLTEEYLGQYAQKLGEIESGLKNDAQRIAFARYRQQSELGLRERLERHKASELQTWRLSNNRGMTKVLSDTITMSWADPQMTREASAQLKANIAQLTELSGLGAAEVEATQKAILGQAHAGAIEQMIAEGKWQAAQEYLNEHRADMDGDSQFKAMAKIDGEGRVAMGVQAGDQIADAYLTGQALSGPQKFMAPGVGQFPITSKFGKRARPKAGASANHPGVDIGMPPGTPVSASADGWAVVKSDPKGYGTYVEVDHGDGYVTRYAHLGSASRKVGERFQVRQGDILGKSGNSGNSTGPHLHFEVRKDGRPVDPMATHTVNRKPVDPAGGLTGALREVQAQYGHDPRLAKVIEARVKERFSARDYDRRQSENETKDAAIAYMAENGTSFFDLPSSIRSSVDPSDIPSLISFGNAMRDAVAGPGVSSEQSVGEYGVVMDGITSGRISSVAQLAPHRPYLTAQHYKELVNKLSSAQKGGGSAIDSIASTNKAMSLFRTEITAAGITPKDTDADYQRLKGQAYIEIDRAERIKKAPLTSQEQRQIILGLLADSAAEPGGLFGWGSKRNFEVAPTERRVVYSAIPPAVRREIVDGLIAQGWPREDITQGRVEDLYARMEALSRAN